MKKLTIKQKIKLIEDLLKVVSTSSWEYLCNICTDSCKKLLIKPSAKFLPEFTSHKYWNNYSFIEDQTGWWTNPFTIETLIRRIDCGENTTLDFSISSKEEVKAQLYLIQSQFRNSYDTIRKEIMGQKKLYLEKLIEYYKSQEHESN